MNQLKKFPSLQIIYQSALDTIERFPFALLSALSATVCAIILSESDNVSDEFIVQKILLVSLLGLPLLIVLKMFADRYHWKYLKSLGLQTIGFILLLLYYLLLPEDMFELDKYVIQYSLLYICFLFLNAFLPYLQGKNIQGFWQYNKSFFIGFLIATLYVHVLGTGLSIALAAMDHLFNMDIDPKRYFQIWIIVSLLFHPILFLARIPISLDSLNNDQSYPKGLKVFTQYILLPLVGLYLLILYTYEAKIIFEWNWPVGWVSNLVLWYSVVSILSLLLLHPLREMKENRWIQIFSKWFFRALLPLVVMLFLAIIQRISDYGITEARFVVFAMAVGLAIVVLYFVISKAKDIRIIPVVISLLAIISAFSASTISKNSQQSRLDSLLIQNNLFVEGKLVKSDENIVFDSRKEMSSIIDYLLSTHGIESLNRWVEDTVLQNYKTERKIEMDTSQVDRSKFGSSANDICSLLGFEYENRWSSASSKNNIRLQLEEKSRLEISTFEILYQLSSYSDDTESISFDVDSLNCYVQLDMEKATIALYIGDSLTTYDDLGEMNLSDTLRSLNKLNKKDYFQQSDLSFSFIGQKYEAKIIFYNISSVQEQDKFKISSFDAVLLLKKKK